MKDTSETVVVNSSSANSPGQTFRELVNNLYSANGPDTEKEKEVIAFLMPHPLK